MLALDNLLYGSKGLNLMLTKVRIAPAAPQSGYIILERNLAAHGFTKVKANTNLMLTDVNIAL